METNDIRSEKATIIEDIFRVIKISDPIKSINWHRDIPQETIFDHFYDKDIEDLEVILAMASAQLNRYMKKRARANIKDLTIKTAAFHYKENIFKINYN